MSSVKFVSLSLAIVLVSCSAAFAGAPSPVMERPIPVEQVSPAPVPAAPSAEKAQPLVISRHFTLGVGLGGNPWIGTVDKDQYGYPRSEAGLCSGIGFAITWFKGQPSAEDINAAVQKIKASNPAVSDKELPSLVRKELNVGPLSYVGLGVLNAEIGYEYILGDNVRTRLGIGLPTIISFGINFDF